MVDGYICVYYQSVHNHHHLLLNTDDTITNSTHIRLLPQPALGQQQVAEQQSAISAERDHCVTIPPPYPQSQSANRRHGGKACKHSHQPPHHPPQASRRPLTDQHLLRKADVLSLAELALSGTLQSNMRYFTQLLLGTRFAFSVSTFLMWADRGVGTLLGLSRRRGNPSLSH